MAAEACPQYEPLEQSAMSFEQTADRPKPLTLRPYQQKAVQASLRAYEQGTHRQVLHMATGTGKTVVLCDLIRKVPSSSTAKRILIMAHRDELIDQMASSIQRMNPDMKVSIEQGTRHADEYSDVIVASVATLGRKDPTDPEGYGPRLKRFSPAQFKMVAIDEVHHAVASTYTRVLKYFGLHEPGNTGCMSWGCTATPNRSDGHGLRKLYDEIVFSYGIVPAIEDGWLCRLSAIRVQTETSLADVRTRAGEYVANDLSEAVNNELRNDMIVDAWDEHCRGERHSTMVFCVDVKHVYDIIDAFKSRGIDARGADGTTNKDERREMVQGFRDRKFPVLVNCGLWTEGSDFPAMDAIIMARPTQSATLYTQIIGRGTRLYPDKKDCLIVDMVDAAAGKDLMTIPNLFGLDTDFDMNGQDVVKVYKQVSDMIDQNPKVIQAKSVKEAEKMIASPIDLLAFGEEDQVIRNSSKLKWRKVNDTYILHVDVRTEDASKRHASLTISKDMLDRWQVRLHHGGEDVVVRERNDIIGAINAADNYVRSHFPDAVRLVDKTAKWRTLPMSEKQIEFFTANHMKIPEGMTRGQASDEIDKKILQFKRRRKRRVVKKMKTKSGGIRTRVDNVKVGAI